MLILAIIKETSFQWLKGSILSNIKISDSETFRREIFYYATQAI